jgi:hypothetical protein
VLQILKYLLLIRLRKWVSKDDYLAYFILLLLHSLGALFFYFYFEDYKNYIFLCFFDVLVFNANREDSSFLKLSKNFKAILFFEYILYLLPYLIVLFLKTEWLFIAIFLLLNVILINLPILPFKIISYPFELFNVFWHISFRKHKLLFVYPIIFTLCYIYYLHKNDNVLLFGFLLLTLVSCIASFEREKAEEIIINPFNSEKYLSFQLKNTLINTFYVFFPAVHVFSILNWEMLVYILPVFVISITATLLKYIYFNNIMLQQLVFVILVVLSITLFGLPMLLIPYLYKKAISNLNSIKYVSN